MIAKGKSIAHAANAINYARGKDEAIEIDRNLVSGESGIEIASEFRIFQQFNPRVSNNSISFVISPEIEVGKSLLNKDFREITQTFLKELNLIDHQYVCYLHQANHRHLHLFVNRLNKSGITFNDSFISKKAQAIAEKIAKDRGYITAREIQEEREARLRNTVEKAHKEVLRNNPKDIEAYSNLLNAHNIETKLKYAKNGKLVGISFKVGDHTIKGSSVNKNMSAKNLEETLSNISKSVNKSNYRSM